MISESTNRADSTDGYGAIFKRAAESRRVMLLEDLAEARRAGDNAAAKIAGYKLEALKWPQDFGPRQVHDHFERLARGRHQFTSDTRHSWLEERENRNV